MPIAMPQESGSDTDPVKVSSKHTDIEMVDEKPSITVQAEVEDSEPDMGRVKQEQDNQEKEQDELEEKIEAAVKKFRERTASVKKAAWPFAQKTIDFSNHYPVLFTFLAIFGALSIVPVGFFIGFLLSAVIFIVSTAIIGICLSTLTCILIGASVLFPILVFTTIVSTFILSGLISLFLVHRFYLHLRAACSSSGQFRFSVDSVLTACVDFGIETAARVGIDISPGTSAAATPAHKTGNKASSQESGVGKVKWDVDAQAWIDRKEWHDIGTNPNHTGLVGKSQESHSEDIKGRTTLERIAALAAAQKVAAGERGAGRFDGVGQDEKAGSGPESEFVVPTITFRGPQ